MKDQIDVAVRRSPKYSVFMGIGAVLGVIVAGVLAMFVDPADMPMGYTVAKGVGLLLLVLGVGGLFIGGLIALILDWAGRKRAKEFRVDAQIDMVDDPKEIARRRIAEARGEDPDAAAAPAVEAAADADGTVAVEGGAASANADGALEVEDTTDNGGAGRGPAPDSTV
ncbi:hypothetical protein [Brevibacterium sp. FAM 24630]|uniref:hypothetical protein n=1 Tax=unclassified Brevibacterium TaxID=2614124 RepID=UPI003C7AD12F